jgi:RNA polymerase sigma-70 factor (ECF subfamily)
MRRAGVQAPVLDGEELARIEELASLGELRAAVAGALADLAAEQRDAVRLRVVEELDYAQVAGRLGISEQAARARVSRGLRAIAGALDGFGPAEAAP